MERRRGVEHPFVLFSYAYKPRKQKSPLTAIHSRSETGPSTRVRARRTVRYAGKYEDPCSYAVVAMSVQERVLRYDRLNAR